MIHANQIQNVKRCLTLWQIDKENFEVWPAILHMRCFQVFINWIFVDIRHPGHLSVHKLKPRLLAYCCVQPWCERAARTREWRQSNLWASQALRVKRGLDMRVPTGVDHQDQHQIHQNVPCLFNCMKDSSILIVDPALRAMKCKKVYWWYWALLRETPLKMLVCTHPKIVLLLHDKEVVDGSPQQSLFLACKAGHKPINPKYIELPLIKTHFALCIQSQSNEMQWVQKKSAWLWSCSSITFGSRASMLLQKLKLWTTRFQNTAMQIHEPTFQAHVSACVHVLLCTHVHLQPPVRLGFKRRPPSWSQPSKRCRLSTCRRAVTFTC